ncbi:MAG: hypothetical protein V3S01_02030, partial [Dehalococcoidia bacterium]
MGFALLSPIYDIRLASEPISNPYRPIDEVFGDRHFLRSLGSQTVDLDLTIGAGDADAVVSDGGYLAGGGTV